MGALTCSGVESVALVRRWLEAAESVAVLTGAGISAESGIPTFRGPDGLWRHYRPEDLATPQAFERDPKLVWEWYEWRRGLIAAAEPNDGHRALGELARRKKFTLISQNVDSLHERAGSREVLKLHGDILVQRCVACGRDHRHADPQPNLPPRCACGGLERPGVVWFGEPLPEDVLARAIEAARAAELFLVIGTSAAVYPAAGLLDVARAAGARVVEINVAETQASRRVDLSWRAPAAEALPKLLA